MAQDVPLEGIAAVSHSGNNDSSTPPRDDSRNVARVFPPRYITSTGEVTAAFNGTDDVTRRMQFVTPSCGSHGNQNGRTMMDHRHDSIPSLTDSFNSQSSMPSNASGRSTINDGPPTQVILSTGPPKSPPAQGRLAPACKQLKRGMQDAGKSIEAAGKTASSSLKSFSKLAEAAANVLNKWFFIFSVSWTMVLVISLLFVDGVPSFFKNFVTLFATSCLGLAFFALIGCFGCVTFALIDPKACEEFASSRLEAFRALNLFLAKL